MRFRPWRLLAGYRAVILAAQTLPKMFPMMMTAAGTITPAKVFVLGAGVAGLQAIATAEALGRRRLRLRCSARCERTSGECRREVRDARRSAPATRKTRAAMRRRWTKPSTDGSVSC